MADKRVHGGTFQPLPERQLHILETPKIKFDEGFWADFLSVALTNKFWGNARKKYKTCSPTVQTFFRKKNNFQKRDISGCRVNTRLIFFWQSKKKSFNTITFPLSGQWIVFFQKIQLFFVAQAKKWSHHPSDAK
jgi:hypothetical protein